MHRHPVLTRIRKPTRQTDNPVKDVGVGREPLARIIAPLQEEDDTAEINDDDHVASPPGCSGTGSSTDISTENAVPDSGGRAMARESMDPAVRPSNKVRDDLTSTRQSADAYRAERTRTTVR